MKQLKSWRPPLVNEIWFKSDNDIYQIPTRLNGLYARIKRCNVLHPSQPAPREIQAQVNRRIGLATIFKAARNWPTLAEP